ncbi:MAG: CBS domain-containing protein, partial [Thermoplasmata archaeon]|nr:CBS domain-containing protein [Thermoplasmata archaeon]
DASGRVGGVLSERDVARVYAGALSRHDVKGLLDILTVGFLDQREPWLRSARQRLEEMVVADAMTSPAYVIRPDAPLELAAEIMVENSINRIPVVEGEHLVGIVTRNDLVRAVATRSE